MTEITVPSGAKVVINPADFRASIALKNALQRELAKSNTTLKMNLNSVKPRWFRSPLNALALSIPAT